MCTIAEMHHIYNCSLKGRYFKIPFLALRLDRRMKCTIVEKN